MLSAWWREPIPDDVKKFVWRRDQGHCVRCGSRRNLDFARIVPRRKGGSDGAQNVHVLCESCSRATDPRALRFNQAVICTVLMVAFLGDWRVAIPAVAVALVPGAALGPRWDPLQWLYATLLQPRLGPPPALEDPRPPRFAMSVAVGFLAASTTALIVGATALAWVIVMFDALLAGLVAAADICLACELYTWAARRRGVRLAA